MTGPECRAERRTPAPYRLPLSIGPRARSPASRAGAQPAGEPILARRQQA
jgi:hypothetical protein